MSLRRGFTAVDEDGEETPLQREFRVHRTLCVRC